VDIVIDSCRIGEQTKVVFSVSNASADDLEYKFQSGSRVLSHRKGAFDRELEGSTIAAQGDKYVFAAPPLSATMVQIKHPACVGRQYTYAKADCMSGEQDASSVNGKELKCNGYMEIEERIKCRLSLRDSEYDEHENFFPEYCRAQVNQGLCIAQYRAVQQCWDEDGKQRFACAARQLQAENIPGEKQRCRGLAGAEQDACFGGLQEKGYSLVRFYLYNLEEQAEELLEAGRLDEDAVIAFTKAVELKKLEFDAMQGKEGKKRIVLEVRGLWRGLLQDSRAS